MSAVAPSTILSTVYAGSTPAEISTTLETQTPNQSMWKLIVGPARPGMLYDPPMTQLGNLSRIYEGSTPVKVTALLTSKLVVLDYASDPGPAASSGVVAAAVAVADAAEVAALNLPLTRETVYTGSAPAEISTTLHKQTSGLIAWTLNVRPARTGMLYNPPMTEYGNFSYIYSGPRPVKVTATLTSTEVLLNWASEPASAAAAATAQSAATAAADALAQSKK